MVWIVGIGLAVIAVVALWIVFYGRARTRHDILQKLRAGVRFKAHDDSGGTITGECTRVIDAGTIEALYSKSPGSRREKGTIPIHRIFDVSS